MSELLFENPLTIGIAGGACTLIALVMWIKGGFRAAFYSALGLAVLTAILLFINVSVKTDREQVEQVLYDVAAAVARNDFPAVLAHVHPNAIEGLQRAKNELPSYHFTDARITGIKSIEVKPNTPPPTATAEFYVAVAVEMQGSPFRGNRFVRAHFRKLDGRWLVYNYEHYSIESGLRSTEPSLPFAPLRSQGAGR
jgi:hypothetical protein